MCERQRNSLAVLAKECQVPKVGGTRCIIEGSVAGQVVASGDTKGCQELKAMPRPPSLGILGTAPHRRLVIGLPLSPSLLSVSPVLPQCRFAVPHTGWSLAVVQWAGPPNVVSSSFFYQIRHKTSPEPLETFPLPTDSFPFRSDPFYYLTRVLAGSRVLPCHGWCAFLAVYKMMYGYKSQAWKVVLLVKTGDLHLGVFGYPKSGRYCIIVEYHWIKLIVYAYSISIRLMS